MFSSAHWLIIILGVLFAGIIGFVIGRRQSPAENEMQKLTEHHQQLLAQKQHELDAYREEVNQHYDKTAGLFMSMADSYKDLFDHLSEGYEKLGDLSTQKKLPDRAGALLDGPEANEVGPSGAFDTGMPNYSIGNSTASRDD